MRLTRIEDLYKNPWYKCYQYELEKLDELEWIETVLKLNDKKRYRL